MGFALLIHRNSFSKGISFFPFMSVGGNVDFCLRVRGVGKAEICRRVQLMLELVRLPGVAGRSTRELSCGQQQRVALARALITEPYIGSAGDCPRSISCFRRTGYQ
ncbi:MAG: ATP-binding cassette domain-containing protein [Spirochaetota bacterium]